jgi:hypothetical protein
MSAKCECLIFNILSLLSKEKTHALFITIKIEISTYEVTALRTKVEAEELLIERMTLN